MDAQGSDARRKGIGAMPLQSDEKAIVHVADDDPSTREPLQNLFLSIGLATRTYGTARDFLATVPVHRNETRLCTYAAIGMAAICLART